VPGSQPVLNVSRMKKTKKSDAVDVNSDGMRPEYVFDYRKARSNRFADRIGQGPSVITLDPDVSQVFTTSESVNAVLRALIESMPKSH
jgi:hypothetical protein